MLALVKQQHVQRVAGHAHRPHLQVRGAGRAHVDIDQLGSRAEGASEQDQPVQQRADDQPAVIERERAVDRVLADVHVDAVHSRPQERKQRIGRPQRRRVLTPGSPPQLTEFSSVNRNGNPARCAIPTAPATILARRTEAL